MRAGAQPNPAWIPCALGVQMNHHSTLVSYLHRVLILVTGSFGRPGTHFIPTVLVDITNGEAKRTSPVTGDRLVGGLVPCNVIADEILTDHPKRYRAMLVEAANPAHSLADSKRMREALSALDTLVVIDVAMTETFPFVLSAGERRSFTANTIIRDPTWRKKDGAGALRINPDDAATLGVTTGESLRLITRRSAVVVPIEVSATMQRGHVSLPNGLGLTYPSATGETRVGVAPNELTSGADRDPFVGTPWHKHVPARLERV